MSRDAAILWVKHVAVAVTIVPLCKAFKFHIASSLSLVAMDSIRNEVSRVINISCKNLFRNRAKINKYPTYIYRYKLRTIMTLI